MIERRDGTFHLLLKSGGYDEQIEIKSDNGVSIGGMKVDIVIEKDELVPTIVRGYLPDSALEEGIILSIYGRHKNPTEIVKTLYSKVTELDEIIIKDLKRLGMIK